MQIIPTIKPVAKMHGEDIVIPVQEDVTIRLSLNEAMSLAQSTMRQVREALETARFVKADEAQIIAFPVHAARRA